uniref:Secreted protein n=1 Tax=Caenorhabditis tropicalis TaxID=1561998 RepID=A0A1I7TXE5_9PELO
MCTKNLNCELLLFLSQSLIISSSSSGTVMCYKLNCVFKLFKKVTAIKIISCSLLCQFVLSYLCTTRYISCDPGDLRMLVEETHLSVSKSIE